MPEGTGRSRRKAGPSIEDVARLAGVSAQTVSRVSTGAASVRPATRDRVLAAMGQLGYAPNRAARALRNGSFGTLGLLAHRFERTGEALTTKAIVEAAKAENHSVTLLDVDDPGAAGWEHAVQRLSHQAIDGLVIIRAEHATPDTLALPAGLPIAVSDSRLMGYYPGVVADQIQGTETAVRHLLGLGHRTVHHVAGPADSDPAALRSATWQRCLEEVGIRPPPLWRGDWSAASGYAAGQRIAEDRSVTAVYCANDEMAFGLMGALAEHGRRIPGDVSVVGFDDIGLAGYSIPPLTTVRQDFRRIGHELVRLVLAQLDHQSVLPLDRVVIPTEFVIRGSTAPPPS
ncbi:MAG: LacI family DNA-binding transcriptional regulator [Propionicimonas sp.]